MHFKVDVVAVVLKLCYKTERRGNSPAWLVFRHRTNELKETVSFRYKQQERKF